MYYENKEIAFLSYWSHAFGSNGFFSPKRCACRGRHRVNIPAYTFAAPPPMVMIPGTYAYFVPDINVDILFYHGYWYRPYKGRWYRATFYNGPWVFVAPARIPRVLIGLPPDYRRIPPGYRRVPYGEFRRNWRTWEKNRYWERDERWRGGRQEERREERREEYRERER